MMALTMVTQLCATLSRSQSGTVAIILASRRLAAMVGLPCPLSGLWWLQLTSDRCEPRKLVISAGIRAGGRHRIRICFMFVVNNQLRSSLQFISFDRSSRCGNCCGLHSLRVIRAIILRAHSECTTQNMLRNTWHSLSVRASQQYSPLLSGCSGERKRKM